VRLAHILHLFHENAADLFPRKIQHLNKEPITPLVERPTRKKMKKLPHNVALPAVDPDLDPEVFPEQFSLLAKDIMTLLNCLNEFPGAEFIIHGSTTSTERAAEFTDETVDASIRSFEADLKVTPHVYSKSIDHLILVVVLVQLPQSLCRTIQVSNCPALPSRPHRRDERTA
jgi:WD repeat-containing protein 26